MRIRTAGVSSPSWPWRSPPRAAAAAETTPRPRPPPLPPAASWSSGATTSARRPQAVRREVRPGERRHRRGAGHLQGPADHLRHRVAAGQRPGRDGRRARLDRQPRAERRDRPGATDRRAAAEPGTERVKAVTFNGQVYGVPYATENLALIRNTELAPAAPATIEDLVAQARSSRRRRRRARSSACRSARTATPTTRTRCSARPAATCSAPPPAATTTRTTWASASPSRSPRSRRSRRWARRARVRSSARSPWRTPSRPSPRASAPTWSPVRGRSPTRRRPDRVRHLAGARLRRRQAGPAVPRRAVVLRRGQGQEQGAGPGVRHQLRDHAGTGRRAVPGRAPPAGADRRVRPGQGHRPGPGEVRRRRQERGAAARDPGDGASGTRSARPRPPSSPAPTPRPRDRRRQDHLRPDQASDRLHRTSPCRCGARRAHGTA
jgi:hypothetical protein